MPTNRPGYYRQYRQKQIEKDPEAWSEYERKHNATQRQKRRESDDLREAWNSRMRVYGKEKRLQSRMKIINLLGGKCIRCGFSDHRALQIDHINGGGSKAHKAATSKSGHHRQLHKDVEANPEKYQLLCANCNWIKRYEEHEVLGT